MGADDAAVGLLARLGLAARGALYLVLGVLVFDLAASPSEGRQADQRGALAAVAAEPLGELLLGAIAVGLAGYALWRLVRALRGRGPGGARDEGLERLGSLGSGLLYAFFSALAVQVLVDGRLRAGAGSTRDQVIGIMQWPAGRVIVVLIGLSLVGVGLNEAKRGVTAEFVADQRSERLSRTARRLLTAAGVAGYVARAVVFALVGSFLVRAGATYSPDDAVGLDGALRRLEDAPYGPAALGAVGAGLILFALFSFGEAGLRRL